MKPRHLHFVRATLQFCLTFCVVAVGTLGAERALAIPLQCSSLHGSIIFAYPFESTSGACSTGSFQGVLNDPIEGIVVAAVSMDSSRITHSHDVRDIGSGTNWLVSTLASFAFFVTPDVGTITLRTSPSSAFDEVFLQIQGPSGSLSFLGGGWQSAGSPPAGTAPLGGNALDLLPGNYTGFYRFRTFTSSGHRVESVWLSFDATVVPEARSGVLIAIAIVLVAALEGRWPRSDGAYLARKPYAALVERR